MELASALQQVRKATAAIQPLSEEVWNDFAAIWQPLSAMRKTVLTTAGETEKYLYFVTSGVQRAFTITDDNKEATLVLRIRIRFLVCLILFFCKFHRVII